VKIDKKIVKKGGKERGGGGGGNPKRREGKEGDEEGEGEEVTLWVSAAAKRVRCSSTVFTIGFVTNTWHPKQRW